MDFGVWTVTGGDTLRKKRLAVGYVMGMILVAGLSALVVLNAKAIAAEKEEDILDVKLATEPEPEPEPEPAPQVQEQKKPQPRPRLQTPMEVPKDKPAEVDPSKVANPLGNDDPFARDDDKPAAPPPKEEKPVVKEAPKPVVKQAPPRSKGPIQITENVTPPQPLSNAPPPYPPEAKAAGIEGTVVVKFVVTEQGTVTNVQVLRGPPELHQTVITTVKTWRFRPAMLDGQPVAVTKVQPLRFRIKT
jgi:protein TonB